MSASTFKPSGFPWAGQPDEIGCNFAFGHLVRGLPDLLADEQGRINAETLMCAAGAIAGFGAHISLISDPAAWNAAAAAGKINIVKMNDDRELLFGDAINDMLSSADAHIAPKRVWNVLAGTAISNGASAAALPDLGEMFAHVARSLGSDDEGRPSVPELNQPHLSVREILVAVGPFAVKCLTGKISETTARQGFAASETSWVAVTAHAAASQLSDVSGVLDPLIAARIAMESAIYASKLRPVLQAPVFQA